MGPLRRGVIIGLVPVQAAAEVCDKERPSGRAETPTEILSEVLHLFLSPIGIVAAGLFILAVTTRKPFALWASCLASLGLLAALVINPGFPDPSGVRYFAVIEGCIRSQTLSILLCTIFAGTAAFLARRGRTPRGQIGNS